MLTIIPGYETFMEIVDNEIIAYDIDEETRQVDYSTIGILKTVDIEFSKAICKALEIDSVENYGVEIKYSH